MIPSRRVSFFGTGSDRLNDTVVNTVRHLFRRGWPRGFFLSGMLLPLLFGCIREDRSDCFPVAETRFVVLKIVDEATGQDITQTGEAGSAVLYLFSQGGRFVDRISGTRERIMKRAPIPLPDGTPGRCRAVVWANAGTGQRFHSPAAGSRIEDRAVSLIEEDDTFHHTPDDLFFGRARLGPTGEAASEEITLIRKNARIHITARGLDRNTPEDLYYFTVEIPDDGYDFAGNPISGTAHVRRTGTFRDNGDFSTDGTFNLVHTDEADSQADEVIVNLYERMSARSADRLLASVTEVDGDRISLPAGRTLNLLIELNEGGGLSIRMEITPWNEIYQWDIW